MKVSERVNLIRQFIDTMDIATVDKDCLEIQLMQLEVDVVAMVQEARYDGYRAGLDYGLSFRIDERG